MLYNKFNPEQYKDVLISFFKELLDINKISEKKLRKLLTKYPKDNNSLFSKDQLISGFKFLIKQGLIKKQPLPSILQMKPTRTQSGVTTVTVLTKPFPCPGKCIFCPNDIRMPKSYIASEPGAQRALKNRFNPYLQVTNRLAALNLIGHPTDKVEVLVLGGTWSYYPKIYQLWFIKEIFRALNDFIPEKSKPINAKNINNRTNTEDINLQIRSKYGNIPYNNLIKTQEYRQFYKNNVDDNEDCSWENLFSEQKKNENATSRCVGLVLETRPDRLNEKEVLILRKFGATKIQIGVQTLDPKVNKLNKRMESKEQISNAFKLLRLGGFKIHAHIMPNLYGADYQSDLKSYQELFNSSQFKPDELKIYPTSIIKNTELSNLYKDGKYKPYSAEILTKLITNYLKITPAYCRITRIIRDIPAQEIITGNKISNLRETVESHLVPGKNNLNIRSREIKSRKLKLEDLKFDQIEYDTEISTEHFLQFITDQNEIAGFLRLSVPKKEYLINPITDELNNSAIIREIHVYGPSLEIGKDSTGQAQHLGLGTKLILEAIRITKNANLNQLSVISAIGTREYYRKKGFKNGVLYQYKDLEK